MHWLSYNCKLFETRAEIYPRTFGLKWIRAQGFSAQTGTLLAETESSKRFNLNTINTIYNTLNTIYPHVVTTTSNPLFRVHNIGTMADTTSFDMHTRAFLVSRNIFAVVRPVVVSLRMLPNDRKEANDIKAPNVTLGKSGTKLRDATSSDAGTYRKIDLHKHQIHLPPSNPSHPLEKSTGLPWLDRESSELLSRMIRHPWPIGARIGTHTNSAKAQRSAPRGERVRSSRRALRVDHSSEYFPSNEGE